MTLEEECKHGLAPGTCSLCKPQPPKTAWHAVERAPGVPVQIASRYAGTCRACGGDYAEGQTITLMARNVGRDDEDERWICCA